MYRRLCRLGNSQGNTKENREHCVSEKGDGRKNEQKNERNDGRKNEQNDGRKNKRDERDKYGT